MSSVYPDISPVGSSALPPIKVGMLAFLVTEAAFFGTLMMAYVFFLGQTSRGEPNPRQVFGLPIVLVASTCLLASSVTIHQADRALRDNSRSEFLGWWGATIGLGVFFLAGTAWEWSELIGKWGLTISRNLFGSTYFTLVGFHALHVSVGLIAMSIVFGLAQQRRITQRNQIGVEVISWYWHFVDGVWVLVFTLVYIVGR